MFDFLKKNQAPPRGLKKAPVSEALAVYSHMRVEVMNADGQLLFVAKLINPHGTQAELQQILETETPKSEEPIHVRMRGYHDGERKAVYMEGVITPKPEEEYMWQVEELIVSRTGNDRAFFRLDMEVDASITSFTGIGAGSEKPCKLKDISVGGARITSDQQHLQGDKFMLNVRLMEDQEPCVMFCEVMRVTEKEDSTYEYGCHFVALKEADEEKITQNIFNAQRKRRGVPK